MLNKIITFLLILKIKTQIFSLYETLNGNITISSTTKELERNKSYIKISKYIYNEKQTPLIQVDQFIPNKIKFIENNLNFGIGYPILKSLVYGKTILGINNISIINFHNDKVFYPQKYSKNTLFPLIDYQKDNFIVDCNFTNMFFDYNFITFNGNNIYTKFDFFFKFTFGLFKGELFIIFNFFEKENKFSDNNCEGKINDFFITNKFGENINEGYLFLYISEEKKICIYNLYLESSILKYKYKNKILNINSNILDIKSYKENIFYSLKGEKKIKQISINNTSKIIEYTNKEIQNDIISFVVLEETIYLIEKNKGMIIFDKINLKIRKRLNYEKAIKLDYFINAFNGNKFIGLYLNNSDNNYSDFFIEFLIINEINPLINKVLLYPDKIKPTINQILTIDYFFTYIYDKNNKQIIIIKRGSLSNIPFVSFKIDLKEFKNNFDSQIFPIYFGNNESFISILDDKKYYLIKGKFVESNLTCNFKKVGIYNIIFLQNQDFCSSFSKNDNIHNSFLFCINILIYRYNVLENKNIKIHLIPIISILSLIVFILVLLYYKYKKIKIVFDKNNLDYLYIESNSINNSKNSQNQFVGELESKSYYLNDSNLSQINNRNFFQQILNNNKKTGINKQYNPQTSETSKIKDIDNNDKINENKSLKFNIQKIKK